MCFIIVVVSSNRDEPIRGSEGPWSEDPDPTRNC
jgi:hypothetical protein